MERGIMKTETLMIPNISGFIGGMIPNIIQMSSGTNRARTMQVKIVIRPIRWTWVSNISLEFNVDVLLAIMLSIYASIRVKIIALAIAPTILKGRANSLNHLISNFLIKSAHMNGCN
jgi:hypothetical protein